MGARKTPSRGAKPDKIMRDALALELKREEEAELDGKKQKVKRFRLVADALVKNAIKGETSAIREIYDRMDGKVPQALVGDDNSDPIRVGDVTDEQRARALAVFIAKNGGNSAP